MKDSGDFKSYNHLEGLAVVFRSPRQLKENLSQHEQPGSSKGLRGEVDQTERTSRLLSFLYFSFTVKYSREIRIKRIFHFFLSLSSLLKHLVLLLCFPTDHEERYICLGLPVACFYHDRALHVRHVHAFPSRIQ